MIEDIKKIASEFCFDGNLIDITSVKIGLINNSFILEYDNNSTRERYLLQKINTFVFKEPSGIMDNVVAVTDYIYSNDKKTNSYDYSKTINVIPTKDGSPILLTSDGEYYRAYNYIENTYTIDAVNCCEDAFNAGKAFGNFIFRLKDFEAEKLCVTIPDFHNTKKRYLNLLDAVEKNEFGRLDEVGKELEIIEKSKNDAFIIGNKSDNGEIPIRVIHNDTKINNVLFDKDSHDVVCVVDLDTIMPGSFLHDFGDAITTGAVKPGASGTTLVLDYFESYAKGFLFSCGKILTDEEIRCMPLAAKTLAFEQAVRFLTDYLCGDVYFRTEYPKQNLERTDAVLSLLIDINNKFDQMQEIINKLLKEFINE